MSLLSILKSLRPKKPPACTAVIAAAGLSQRCKGEDKLFYNINNKPVLAYTLEPFQNCELINDIIIVSCEERYEHIDDICKKYGISKVSKIIKGGQTRLESVFNGVFAATHKAGLFAIHDGARPCINADLLEKTIHAAAIYNAAAPAVAVTSTIKRVDATIISETVDREDLYEIQTPQIFRSEVIKAALSNAIKKSISITDDCMAVEIIGVPIHIVQGSRLNIKITDREDLFFAEALLSGENKL